MQSVKHIAAFAVAGVFVVATSTARADQWDKRTTITINGAVQLPTVVLQPGSYVLKLLNSPSDRHIVQVFDGNERHLITTVLAINNYRLEPTGKSVFTFWETPAGYPPALRAWFYPGDDFGQEFAYPKKMAGELAALNKTFVPTTNSEEPKTAEVGAQSEPDKKPYTAPTDEQTAQATPPPESQATAPQQTAPEPPPVPQPEPQAQPEPQPAQVPSELPHTGSELPLIGLIGLGSLAAYMALSRIKVR